jgi:hypothetical protein
MAEFAGLTPDSYSWRIRRLTARPSLKLRAIPFQAGSFAIKWIGIRNRRAGVADFLYARPSVLSVAQELAKSWNGAALTQIV